jgi:hypothetical protein
MVGTSSYREPIMRRTAAASFCCLLALTGCGGSSKDASSTLKTDAASALFASASRTTSAGSSHLQLTSTSHVGTQDVTIAGGGDFSYVDGNGSLSMTVKIAATTVTLQERVVDKVLYLQIPGQPGWSKISLAKLVGTSLESSADPSSALQYLAGVGKDVTKVGTEKVDGVSTTHYRGTIDIDAASAKLGGVLGERLKQSVAQLKLTAFPFDAYLDDEGRMRRLVQHQTFEVKGEKASSETTLEFSDFGVKVAVAVPPASEVHDGSALLGAFGGKA